MGKEKAFRTGPEPLGGDLWRRDMGRPSPWGAPCQLGGQLGQTEGLEVLQTWVLDSLVERKWQEARWGIQAKLYWDTCAQRSEKKQLVPLLALWGRERWSLKWSEGGDELCGLGLRGGSGGVPIPLVVLCAGIMCFCSNHPRSSSWVWAFLYPIVHNSPCV